VVWFSVVGLWRSSAVCCQVVLFFPVGVLAGPEHPSGIALGNIIRFVSSHRSHLVYEVLYADNTGVGFTQHLRI